VTVLVASLLVDVSGALARGDEPGRPEWRRMVRTRRKRYKERL
jgi:hypothetical protein